MTKYLDKDLWNKHIEKPDWYLRLENEFKRVEKITQNLTDKESEDLKENIYSYIEEKLNSDSIALNKNGPDWDDERKPIDTIVIHHTSHNKPLTLSRLNTKHMLRLYMPFFQNPNDENKDIKGNAISSGHFMHRKQVFYGYHWLVRMDGSIERLLKDTYIGWHAGNWDTNTRSIAICLDGNFENSSPESSVIQAVADLINKNYSSITPEGILGHREVYEKTVCPGNEFIDGWKPKLLGLIKNNSPKPNISL